MLTNMAKPRAGQTTRRGEMPSDLMATISLAADMRPKTLQVANRMVPGIVNRRAMGME
jgi:hypothetical protein